ncbi:MAG: imidazole glycerol phosphate synthase subunit HisF [Brevinematales bacterium]|nr:imidazole glycerol phosphate synthase subunit HisF [Brevinematales bacterium]
MLAKRIIPCLDIDKGRVVKGVKFAKIIDAGDPVENAIVYNNNGADEIVFLDITASYEERHTLVEVARKVADNISIPFTIGGGIRTIEDIREMLLAGADKVSINTSAVKNPRLISEGAEKFGSQCIVVAIDTKKVNGRHKVFIKGGREETSLETIEWAIEVEKLGAGEILLTSIDADGTKDGYDIEILKEVSKNVKIPVIASGGAGKKEHFLEVFTKTTCTAALAASVFHFREIDIQDLKEYLHSNGVHVRLK